jgi:hypothetical protein
MTREEAYRLGSDAVMQMMNKYFYAHQARAADAAVYSLMMQNAQVMRRLRDQPDKCVGYYLGKPVFSREEVQSKETREMLAPELEMKAAIVESALKSPSLAPAMTDEEMGQLLGAAYIEKGFDLTDLAKVTEVETLPATEACEIGLQFLEAMLHLGEAKGPAVLKQLLAASAQ